MFRPRKLFHIIPKFGAPGLVRFFAPGKANDANGLPQLFPDEKMVERRDQLARREIAAGAENNNGARLGFPAGKIEAAGE